MWVGRRPGGGGGQEGEEARRGGGRRVGVGLIRFNEISQINLDPNICQLGILICLLIFT